MSNEFRARGNELLLIARDSISSAMGLPHGVEFSSPWLQQQGASFVTLQQDLKLRGCIGTLEPHRSLLHDVRANAQSAAMLDPRFPSLKPQELDHTIIEVSVLTPKVPLLFASETDVHEQLLPGIDGILIEYGHLRGTFLPQVWDQLPGKIEYMRQLKMKVGLPQDFWSEHLKIYRYRVTKWSEADIEGRYKS